MGVGKHDLRGGGELRITEPWMRVTCLKRRALLAGEIE